MPRTELDPHDRDPLYVQLAEIIRNQILSGEIAPRHVVPSMSELTERYGTSDRTARDAMALLRNEGLIESVRGKGFYVVPPEERPGRE